MISWDNHLFRKVSIEDIRGAMSLEAREADAVELDRLREEGTDIGNSLRQVFIERREQRRTASEEQTG